eukprot:CAMPEP_0179874496 /NCGR_PEP_ID=MMETSP0982-20121206/22894_1 /TAXON_ID=483367 /ORGANISM="non described non described, Strain CCMP 2436" /LENGTH=146 /DNA_ID=CAMNT_0021766245 /DNA_START=129 /DNA_END=569 /DNA_ORIENTATION=-
MPTDRRSRVCALVADLPKDRNPRAPPSHHAPLQVLCKPVGGHFLAAVRALEVVDRDGARLGAEHIEAGFARDDLVRDFCDTLLHDSHQSALELIVADRGYFPHVRACALHPTALARGPDLEHSVQREADLAHHVLHELVEDRLGVK